MEEDSEDEEGEDMVHSKERMATPSDVPSSAPDGPPGDDSAVGPVGGQAVSVDDQTDPLPAGDEAQLASCLSLSISPLFLCGYSSVCRHCYVGFSFGKQCCTDWGHVYSFWKGCDPYFCR